MITSDIFTDLQKTPFLCQLKDRHEKSQVTKTIAVCISIGLSGKTSSCTSVIQESKTKNSYKYYPIIERVDSKLYIDCSWCQGLRSFSSPPEPPLLLQKNVQRDSLTITRDFSWKPGFQYRIRNQEMTTSPSQRSTSLWLARKSHATFSRNFASFSSARA